MVRIKLDEEYILISDSNNWIIAKDEGYKIKHISFHSEITSAIESYFELKSKLCNAESISELLKYQKSLLNRLRLLMTPLKYKIEVKNGLS